MRQGWRWFGPKDPVTLDHARQAGATDIVSALHHRAPGEVWMRDDVARYRNLIETTPAGRSPLRWSVVESIPVADEIKRRGADAAEAVQAWLASLEAVAAEGPNIVCYNFMPVLDWTRTDLDYPLPTGGTALRFDDDRYAAFDLFVLKRAGAEGDYTMVQRARAKAAADGWTDAEVQALTRNILAGLPGTTTEGLGLDAFREKLDAYAGIDADRLRANLIAFVGAVAPVAEKLGVRLTLHPDDPPRPLFGLPRVASTESDFATLLDTVRSPANGMCFCTGSLGVRPDNDLPSMARRFAPRVYFAHLRATKRDADGRSFQEADHLDGDVNMPAVIAALLAEDRRRDEADRIVLRPDHGHRLMGDVGSGVKVNAGYSGVGRLKGLAELRGILRAFDSLPGNALEDVR